MEMYGVERHARIWRKPKNGLTLGIPWEDPSPIGLKQSTRAQISSNRDQTVAGCGSRVRKFATFGKQRNLHGRDVSGGAVAIASPVEAISDRKLRKGGGVPEHHNQVVIRGLSLSGPGRLLEKGSPRIDCDDLSIGLRSRVARQVGIGVEIKLPWKLEEGACVVGGN